MARAIIRGLGRLSRHSSERRRLPPPPLPAPPPPRARRRAAVLDIPLLFATGGENVCDYVVVVSAPAFLQRQRVLARPGMTDERLSSILQKQMPDREKRRRADFVLPTGLGRAATVRAIKKILRQLGIRHA